jgi:hypothetical protein
MASRQTTVFTYKPAGGRLSPVVSVGILISGRWQVVEMYVDSGAFYTLLHSDFATNLGLDFKKGRKVFAQVGDGSLIPVYQHKLPLQIGPTRFKATVGFSEKLGVRFALLGRQDVFERFRFCFHERRRVITFQPVR